ncbi:electron transfer flavoprotein subunit alpha/FixB family protein [Brevibacillus fluminis]|nr:electron transfer flavoprotein subunit alpha/FixB family protein [Brevibacillus fluminis]
MAEIANHMYQEPIRLIGIIVHHGVENELFDQLPFHEVYHIKVPPEKWKLTDYHIHSFQKANEKIAISNGTYLFSSSPLYHEVAVRLSVQNDAGIITNAQEIGCNKENSTLLVKRQIYGEKANEFVSFQGELPQYITLDRAILYGSPFSGKPSIVEQIELDTVSKHNVKFVSETAIGFQDLKITEARCVIGIGRGASESQAWECILPLAEQLNAPIGGSKVADELGLIPREKRIGSSGNSIDADIYIAIGISGSSQHLEGIKGVKHVIAINIDPAAPIFQRCDVGIVGDYRIVVPKIVESLKQGE